MRSIRTSIHPAAWIARWTNENAPRALAQAADLGFDHVVVPLRRFEDIDPPAIGRAFERVGLTPVNAAGQTREADISSPDPATRGRGLERLRSAIRLARDMGSRYVGGVLYSALCKFEHAAPAGALDASAESIAIVAEEARASGIRLAIEIVNRYESNLINTVEQGLSFLERVRCDNVYLHLDTFHMNIEEASLMDALRKALPRLAYFELDQNHRGSLDEGLIDFRPLLAELARQRFDGIVGIEAFSRSTLADDHADALAVWRTTFADGHGLAAAGMRLIDATFPSA
jgi:D-psicose/D-tagatose/L-ribulose 3-epimerase